MCHHLVPHCLRVKLLGPGPLFFKVVVYFKIVWATPLGSGLAVLAGHFAETGPRRCLGTHLSSRMSLENTRKPSLGILKVIFVSKIRFISQVWIAKWTRPDVSITRKASVSSGETSPSFSWNTVGVKIEIKITVQKQSNNCTFSRVACQCTAFQTYQVSCTSRSRYRASALADVQENIHGAPTASDCSPCM